jgi:hypothetical protein
MTMPTPLPALVPTAGGEPPKVEVVRKPALSPEALTWCDRALWALCIGVYLSVFAPGILGQGDELMVMGRAVGLTLLTAILGKIALGFLAQATLPVEEGPSAEEAGPIGSRVEPAASANVAQQLDVADAA